MRACFDICEANKLIVMTTRTECSTFDIREYFNVDTTRQDPSKYRSRGEVKELRRIYFFPDQQYELPAQVDARHHGKGHMQPWPTKIANQAGLRKRCRDHALRQACYITKDPAIPIDKTIESSASKLAWTLHRHMAIETSSCTAKNSGGGRCR